MLSATKAYICCSFMKFAGLESLEDTPSKIELPPDDADNDLKAEFLNDIIGKFVDKYVMVEFADEKLWQAKQKERLAAKEKLPLTCLVPSSLPELLPGQVVVLVIQNTTSGYKVVGVGKVAKLNANIQCQDTVENVPVLVISVEPDAAFIGLRINQIVLWSRKLIGIPNMPSTQEPMSPAEEKSDLNKACQISTENSPDEDRLFNYASQCTGRSKTRAVKRADKCPCYV